MQESKLILNALFFYVVKTMRLKFDLCIPKSALLKELDQKSSPQNVSTLPSYAIDSECVIERNDR